MYSMSIKNIFFETIFEKSKYFSTYETVEFFRAVLPVEHKDICLFYKKIYILLYFTLCVNCCNYFKLRKKCVMGEDLHYLSKLNYPTHPENCKKTSYHLNHVKDKF